MRRRHTHAPDGRIAGLDRSHLLAIVGLVAGLAVLVVAQAWLGARALTPEEARAARVDLAGFSVFLQRRGCAAGCPEYAVLAGGGRVRYEGLAGVALVDRAEAELASDTARALATEVFRAGLIEQPDAWVPGGAQCQAWRHGAEILRFGVTLDGTTRTLDYYTGCDPANPALDGLAARIDTLLDTRRWTLAPGR